MERIIKLTDITTLICIILCIHMLSVLGHGPRQRGILFLGRGTWDVSDFSNLSVVQWVLVLDRTRGRQEMSCWRSVASLLHR